MGVEWGWRGKEVGGGKGGGKWGFGNPPVYPLIIGLT